MRRTTKNSATRAAPPGTTSTMTREAMDQNCLGWGVRGGDNKDRQRRRVEEVYQWARYMSLSHLGSCLCSDPEFCRAILLMLDGEISVTDNDNNDDKDDKDNNKIKKITRTVTTLTTMHTVLICKAHAL